MIPSAIRSEPTADDIVAMNFFNPEIYKTVHPVFIDARTSVPRPDPSRDPTMVFVHQNRW